MTMTCDFGKQPVREVGSDTIYVQDGNLRMVFTDNGEYMYTYNYVNPVWE